MRPRRCLTALALALCSAQMAGAGVPGDADRGETLFRACRACHQVGPDARDGVGPHLNRLLGRPAAALEGFRYSRAMRQAAEGGLVWTRDSLDAFLRGPAAMIPGTRMAFDGVRLSQDRADLIVYIASFTEDPGPGTATAPQDLDPEILALEGDPEYGRYLSSECTTCHQRDGGESGIPSIVHWPEEDFVIALHGYRSGRRTHPAMQMIAGRLSDEEIAALAAYFGSLTE